MTKFIKYSFLFLIAFGMTSAFAAQFEEGKHYEVIAERATPKPEVTEFFSFYCPACNSMEGIVNQLKLNEGIKLKKSHVDFMGGRSQENQQMLTQALAVANVLPEKQQIVSALFNHIHSKRAKFNELQDVRDVFVNAGVDGEKFDKLYKGFAVRTNAKKMQKQQEYFNKKGALGSVPTFIVNGKYKLVLSRDNGVTTPEKISQLINYLASK